MFTPQSLFWYLPLYKLHWHGRIIHNFKIADDLLCGVETKWSSMGNGKISVNDPEPMLFCYLLRTCVKIREHFF